ncbi:MAG: DUF2786 domain-containing protein [Marmoricola sp.]
MSKTLNRIAALLAQAEGTTNEVEADAYLATAQTLATLAAVDLEVARAHQKDKTKREQPIIKQIVVAGKTYNGYTGRGKVQNNAAEYCRLFMDIGNVNDLAFDIASDSTYVIAYGMPSDIEVTEALYASLVVQMKTAVDTAIKAGKHKEDGEEKVWDDRIWDYRIQRPDARRFKTSFYRSFTARIGARLQAAKVAAVREIEAGKSFDLIDTDTEITTPVTASTETGLVLKAKADEVRAFRAAKTNAKGSWKGGSARSTSIAGLRSGREAGDSARLGAPKQIGNRTALGEAS